MSYVVKVDGGYVSGRYLTVTEDIQKARVYKRITDALNSVGYRGAIVPVRIVEDQG